MKLNNKNLHINNSVKTPVIYLGKNTDFLKLKDINFVHNFSDKNKTDLRNCLHSSQKDKVQIMINCLK